MDKLDRYRRIVREVLAPIAARPYSTPEPQHEAVFDGDNDRYLVLTVGWEGRAKRIHHCLAHLDIINGKVWVQRDGTEYGVTDDLEAAGISASDIVLAFHSEEVRPYTGYAVA